MDQQYVKLPDGRIGVFTESNDLTGDLNDLLAKLSAIDQALAGYDSDLATFEANQAEERKNSLDQRGSIVSQIDDLKKNFADKIQQDVLNTASTVQQLPEEEPADVVV